MVKWSSLKMTKTPPEGQCSLSDGGFGSPSEPDDPVLMVNV